MVGNSLVILKALHWMFIFPYKQSRIDLWCEEASSVCESSMKEGMLGFSWKTQEMNSGL